VLGAYALKRRIGFTNGRPRLRVRARYVHYREEDTILEQLDRLPYEAPMVLDTFDAHEVMGSADGLIVIGNGSRQPS
jgi:hypothetical protein